LLKGILNVSSHGGYYRAVKDYLQPVIATMALSMPFLVNLEKERKSALMIGGIYFLIYLLSSSVTRRSGKFSARFRRIETSLNITLLAGFLAGALSGLFYGLDLLLLSIVFFIFVFLVENLRLPAGISWFSEQLEPDVLATALSVESQGKSLITAALALGMGLLADRFGPGTALLSISVLMLVIWPVIRMRKPV